MHNRAMQTLWTIGHSTRAWDVFVAMLGDAGIGTLVDVRRFAGSRRHPQFSGEAMGAALAEVGVRYVPMVDLGGRRTPSPSSRNTLWRNASFRAYADYMETDAYRAARDALAGLAGASPTAVMCAEAVWWLCHRQLIADALVARGFTVRHVMSATSAPEHRLTSFARVEDARVTYPGLI